MNRAFLLFYLFFNVSAFYAQDSTLVDTLVKDVTPFRVAQFGCPHSDVDMNALRNPKWKWKPRRPFNRGVAATIKAKKYCDVFHVLGDWSGQQSVNDKDELILSRAIRDDIRNGREIFEFHYDSIFSLKSLGGNHISKHTPLDSNGVPIPNFDPYSLYNGSVQKSIDALGDSLIFAEFRGDSGTYDYPWEAYYYVKGNNLFFFLSDRNDVDEPWGKKYSTDSLGVPIKGGHPAGAIRKSSLDFFLDVAIKHGDKNIFLHTHQGLPNTVVGTSTKINGWRGHNDKPEATKKWKGTIGALLHPEEVHAGRMVIDQNDSIFNTLLNQWDQLVVGCANSHTHAPINYKGNPVFTGNKGEDPRSVNNDHYGMINKTFIMNVGNLTKHHGHHEIIKRGMHPHGSIWEFYPGSDTLIAHKLIIERSKIYGVAHYAVPGELYKPEEKKYALKYPFDPNYKGKNPKEPDEVSNLHIALKEDSIHIQFEGEADAFGIVSGTDSIQFRPLSSQADSTFWNGKTYIPTYAVMELENGNNEVLRYQGNKTDIKLPLKLALSTFSNGQFVRNELEHTHFLVYALNGSNGQVVYAKNTVQGKLP